LLQVLVVTADEELLKNLTEANRLLEQVTSASAPCAALVQMLFWQLWPLERTASCPALLMSAIHKPWLRGLCNVAQGCWLPAGCQVSTINSNSDSSPGWCCAAS
jgi:hypothetical protein